MLPLTFCMLGLVYSCPCGLQWRLLPTSTGKGIVQVTPISCTVWMSVCVLFSDWLQVHVVQTKVEELK